MSAEKTVVLKHNKTIYIGEISDKKKIISYKTIDKIDSMPLESCFAYVVIIGETDKEQRNDIMMLDRIPIKNSDGDIINLEDISSDIDDHSFIDLGNYALKNFNDKVVYH
jgi:hypothetical protein